MPFFRHTTSLLQLLLDLDHDAIKPDLIVMRLCRRLGIASKEVGDKHFRHAVRFLQEYTVQRKISARALDWALLAFGGPILLQMFFHSALGTQFPKGVLTKPFGF